MNILRRCYRRCCDNPATNTNENAQLLSNDSGEESINRQANELSEDSSIIFQNILAGDFDKVPPVTSSTQIKIFLSSTFTGCTHTSILIYALI